MLPELILREERSNSYFLLFLLGLVSTALGFGVASVIFPSEADLIAVFLAAIPAVYPLTKFFLEDEKEGRPHTPEILTYVSIFAGQVMAFAILGYVTPESFDLQISIFQSQLSGMGITGYAIVNAPFELILTNNLTVFSFILGISMLVGSAGAFVISWNASVFGVFVGVLARELPQGVKHWFSCGPSSSNVSLFSSNAVSPLCYLPHAAFEMTGFIVAGVTGSMMSAAIYREHFDRKTWENLAWMTLTGVGFVFIGAGIETGAVFMTLISTVMTAVFGYLTAKTTHKPEPDNWFTKLLKYFRSKLSLQ